ncbi:6638_t:CDS:2, partial [Gigaspora margarita]
MKDKKQTAPLYVYFLVGDHVLPVPNNKALDIALSKETWFAKFINREETKELSLTSEHKFDQDVGISQNDTIHIYVLAKKEYEIVGLFRQEQGATIRSGPQKRDPKKHFRRIDGLLPNRHRRRTPENGCQHVTNEYGNNFFLTAQKFIK